MVSLSYDLHLHSCLSPCADEDMTPANIAGMAAVKGLDVIAVTDHNSCRNCPAVLSAAKGHGILALPGMEINTSEEVHAICLFAELKDAMEFGDYVYGRLLPFPNREDVFGRQQIYGEDDREVGTEPLLLINSVDISIDRLWDLVLAYHGVMFPAHVDKDANSLISNLGSIPPDSRFQTAEVRDPGRLQELKRSHPYLERCQILHDSDAHSLWEIHEPDCYLTVRDRSAQAVVEALMRPLASP